MARRSVDILVVIAPSHSCSHQHRYLYLLSPPTSFLGKATPLMKIGGTLPAASSLLIYVSVLLSLSPKSSDSRTFRKVSAVPPFRSFRSLTVDAKIDLSGSESFFPFKDCWELTTDMSQQVGGNIRPQGERELLRFRTYLTSGIRL